MTGDAERTQLANERTMLAWWRTGLAALAVALGVGRLLPDLSPHATRWPYVLLGLGFGSFAVGLFIYGTAGSDKERPHSHGRWLATAVAAILTMGTMAVIAVH